MIILLKNNTYIEINSNLISEEGIIENPNINLPDIFTTVQIVNACITEYDDEKFLVIEPVKLNKLDIICGNSIVYEISKIID